MSNDKELLELAAKAAGLRFNPSANHSKGLLICSNQDQGLQRIWNPLTGDGDALRLAVKLRIDIAHAPHFVVTGNDTPGSMKRENGADSAATRRAIVRAAAEIGRAMKEEDK